jgi:hypothetical protein
VRCTDVQNDVTACGSCGFACDDTAPNATPSCQRGQCQYTCKEGWLRCGDPFALGCNTQPAVDPANCGRCGNVCAKLDSAAIHASASCQGGGCAALCDAGWASCGAQNALGCPVNLMTRADNCGSCGNNCLNRPNVVAAACIGGNCQVTGCGPGFGDCDGRSDNGCEYNLTSSVLKCGSCNNNCMTKPNVTNARCDSGRCAVTACSPGTGDCNHDGSDGCESVLNTNANCGGCGLRCPTSVPGATWQCTYQGALECCINGSSSCVAPSP